MSIRDVWSKARKVIVAIAKAIPNMVPVVAFLVALSIVGANAFKMMLWAFALSDWLAAISSWLREGVGIEAIGKPIGYAMNAAGFVLLFGAEIAAVGIYVRWQWRQWLIANQDTQRRKREAQRFEVPAAYDDLVDSLERAHDLMVRGDNRGARHEIERTLEAA
ncbi:MAG: hypothetical protein HOO99_04095 [Hyphomicrobiaceae bacterium]|nr:hypothetical protein [Hyphomicrobiaceae bacterium]